MNKLLVLSALALLASREAQAAPLKARKVVTGREHACALMMDGSIKCWGRNTYGALGLGLPITQSIGDDPGEMGNALPVVDIDSANATTQIATGSSHTCAIYGKGILKCWGANFRGQLGLGHSNDM